MNATGYDISGWQSTTPPLTGVDFVIARAGYGSGNPADRMYLTHAANVVKAGKVLGAYWFWYSGQDNAAAVKQFLALATTARFLCLDLEGTGANTTTGQASAKDFIAKLRAADPQHRKIGLYHSASGYPRALGQDFNWVALWSTTAPDASSYAVPWLFWQNNGAGADNLDNDQYHGTADQLRVWAGLATYTQAQLDAAVAAAVAPLNTQIAAFPAQLLAAKQAQYDLDAKSIAIAPATAKLANPRPT